MAEAGNLPGFATLSSGYAHEVGDNKIEAIKFIINCEDYLGVTAVEFARIPAVYTVQIQLFSKFASYGVKVEI